MNECMFAGRRKQRHAQSEHALPSRGTPQRTQPSRARYSASVSSTMVKGPSFTSSTCMFAPNVPVATRETS